MKSVLKQTCSRTTLVLASSVAIAALLLSVLQPVANAEPVFKDLSSDAAASPVTSDNVASGSPAFVVTSTAPRPALMTSESDTHPPIQFEKWPAVPDELQYSYHPLNEAAQQKAPEPKVGDVPLYHFHAEDMDLKAALALFSRENKLNIVPDEDVSGKVTLDLQDLPLEKVLQALLEAHDFSWTEEDGLIRVRAFQTRSFKVDYLRLTRSGQGSSAVALSSALSSSGGGLGGGTGGGGGSQGGESESRSQMKLTQENPVDFWKELKEDLNSILTQKGKDTLAINKTAGWIQVTDRPSALKRVQDYLSRTSKSVNRQVDIEAKLYDVTLNDQSQWGVDWGKVVTAAGGAATFVGSPWATASFGTNFSSLVGANNANALSPGSGFIIARNAFTANYVNGNNSVWIQALQQQGDVTVISQPRIRTLNNQTAIMKVGTDKPFFRQSSLLIATGNDQSVSTSDDLSYVTVGTVLSVTPQIADDGLITLDVTPAISGFVAPVPSPTGKSSAPELDIKQYSSIVRLRSGQTIVMGGLIQKITNKVNRKVPILGDVPVLGKLFHGDFDAKQKRELVIFLTPTIVP